MFEKLKNIDTGFRQIRGITLYSIAASLVIAIAALWYVHLSRQRVYVLVGGAVMEAGVADKKEYVPVIAKAHIRNFHQSFWTLEPDEKYIKTGISQALYLADESAERLYADYKEAGYYAAVISGNISQTVKIDSILLDTDVYPFTFTCKATETITRPTNITTRALTTTGYIRTTGHSSNNELGFLIEKIRILDNHDIQTKNR